LIAFDADLALSPRPNHDLLDDPPRRGSGNQVAAAGLSPSRTWRAAGPSLVGSMAAAAISALLARHAPTAVIEAFIEARRL